MKSVVVISLCLASVLAVPASKDKPLPIRSHPGGRIVGGGAATADQFPWQVAVYFDTPNATYFCGGALIHPHWVLTAGFCTFHAKVFTLHLGAKSLVDDDRNRVTIAATQSVVHPGYNPNSLTDDIGLIRIDANITLNSHIQTIPMAASALGNEVNVTVSGWGASGDWDGVSNELNYVDLKTISNADCRTIYGETTITDGMVCAIGPTNEGTCNGDSGGPLVVRDPIGRGVHVGIVSWVSTGGCETNHPSGYTRSAYYVDWVETEIRKVESVIE